MGTGNFDSPKASVREVRKGPTSISGKGATVGGFMGVTRSGPTTPTKVSSYSEAEAIFGTFLSTSQLMYNLKLFYANGGQFAYVKRVVGSGAAASEIPLANGTGTILDATASSVGTFSDGRTITTVKKSLVVTQIPDGASLTSSAITYLDLKSTSRINIGDTLRVVSTNGAETDTLRVVVTGINGNRVTFASTSPTAAITVTSPSNCNVELETFDLTVKDSSGRIIGAPFRNLRMSSLSESFYETVINNTFRTPITVAHNSAGDAATDPRPTDGVRTLTGGDDGSSVTDQEWIDGMADFDRVRAVDMLSIPGIFGTSQAVQKALIEYAELKKSFVAIVEIPQGNSVAQALTHASVNVNTFSSYSEGFWYPWVVILDPITGARKNISPCGLRQGIIARTHANRGDAKAAAGVEDGRVAGIIDVVSEVSESDYDQLYPQRINAIQSFEGQGTSCMGNTTLDPTSEIIESGIRFYLLKTRKALEAGTRWVTFELNNETTRQRVVRNVSSFLRNHWKNGLLAGKKESDAYFVICDESNNDAVEVAARRLNIRIGVAVVHAAEFVDITIEQDTRALDAALARGV